ncbi:MBOAT family O-acyltransferase [Desulfobacula phenolica]|nr:MBOAT family protein [Desulfobacula phenolica]
MWLLLIASYTFYAWWDYRFTTLMAFISVVNWTAGRKINHSKSPDLQKMVVIMAVVLSITPLFFFKYLPWLGSYAEVLFNGVAKTRYNDFLSSIILPVGISFFTFQAMSYTIDLYHKKCNYCPNLIKFAGFVSMFPQLVAGPIIRFKDIDSQLGRIEHLDDEIDFNSGLELFFRGLIKKVFFADQLGILIDPSFAAGVDVSMGLAWASILGYTLQIYFDFSGYSDMAIGMGHCLGFKFPENFRAPYTSANPAEFWRRWHITLSTWLRDYVYILMGGNRKGKICTLQNLMVTMLIGGLWHGASWTFVFWGFWHGFMLCIHRITPNAVLRKIPKWIAILMLNLGVIIGWVFFRLPTMDQGWGFLSAMAGFGSQLSILISWQLYFFIPAGYFVHYLERRDIDVPFPRKKVFAIGLAIFAAFSILELGRDAPFIYFQF